MRKIKLSFDEALEAIANEQRIDRADVQSRALARVIWIAEWHLPGCLSESSDVCLTKADAVASALSFANVGEWGEAPRGMKTALIKSGRFDSHSPMFGTCINTVSRATLADIL